MLGVWNNDSPVHTKVKCFVLIIMITITIIITLAKNYGLRTGARLKKCIA